MLPVGFFVGAWLVVLVGFGESSRWWVPTTRFEAGPVLLLAPILSAVGLTLVTVSHLIPIAMGYERVPAYVGADPGG
jgi:hypothetical protein